ncbi:MAG: bifunctional folylpolyglutamate synthase/dihydrofolate synthase, partial [Neisseriaceae bacterium]|nr:bifunctional folylpolyglutamate synthase/dihydrofolate synthase [Neisseriaceae bacterium]
MSQKTLAEWLAYFESVHPSTIDMGLSRVEAVRQSMQLVPKCPVITVSGTNGKGSVCAFLSKIYASAGFKVGTLTSPHLLRFNERIALNAEPVSDEEIVISLERIEVARGDVSLTYFEMNALAAVDVFDRAQVDVMILEVGLGGRLDAVNVFDADCAVVTSVDLDHQAYLGDTIEAVAFEKAGIFRAGKPAVCGQNPVPESMAKHAASL